MERIRVDLESALQMDKKICIELGCGSKPSHDRITIDKLDLPHVDIVADLENGLPFLPDNSIDAVYSRSVLEHVDNFPFLMREIWRVLKPDGKKHLFVPHFSNPYYYSDYTHTRHFGLYSFEYFSPEQNRYFRKVPSFYQDFGFSTEKVRLVFTSPWEVRRKLKNILQKIFNSTPRMQELYEENFCYLFPCYGIEATLSPVK